MHQMTKPRKPRKGEDPDGVYWHEDGRSKCSASAITIAQDVEVEREADDPFRRCRIRNRRCGCSPT